MVNATPQPLCPRERDPVLTLSEAGWAPGPVWTGAEKLSPTGFRSPDHPARNVALYQLWYPDPSTCQLRWQQPRGTNVNRMGSDPGKKSGYEFGSCDTKSVRGWLATNRESVAGMTHDDIMKATWLSTWPSVCILYFSVRYERGREKESEQRSKKE